MYLCMYSSILVGIVHGNFYDESEILNAIPQPKIVLSKRCVCVLCKAYQCIRSSAIV